MDSVDIIAQGLAAKRLLGDEALLAAIKGAQEQIILRWAAAKTVEEREKCHGEYAGIGTVVNEIAVLYQRGEHELTQGPNYNAADA